MTKAEILDIVKKRIEGQGTQIDASSVLPKVLGGILDIADEGGKAGAKIGDLADLQTSAKNTLVAAINEVLQSVPSGTLMIQSEGNTTAGGYQVPSLTVEQVTEAYNAVVGGRGCIIVDVDEQMHAYVNQADNLNNELSIGILFYSSLILTYTISSNAVVITYVELQQTEA